MPSILQPEALCRKVTQLHFIDKIETLLRTTHRFRKKIDGRESEIEYFCVQQEKMHQICSESPKKSSAAGWQWSSERDHRSYKSHLQQTT